MKTLSGRSLLLFLFIILLLPGCSHTTGQPGPVLTGCDQPTLYTTILSGKSVGLVANHTSLIGHQHLADSLIQMGIRLTKIFCPEHGFRGEGDEGALIDNSTDARTGLPIISLYGNKTKPEAADLQGIDIMVYDIQDVGVRFYTYISTLHYVMEACAENHIPLVIMDRPDPLGYYIDGPILAPAFKSFIGLHPIPVVYAMTPGELARMINGEKWLSGGIQCPLTVIPCKNYDHNTFYSLPVDPSPNLNSMEAIYLYPSVCFFEGTVMSLGRGTGDAFRMVGHPRYPDTTFSFIPRAGKSNKNPLLKDQTCYGIDLRSFPMDSLKHLRAINLQWLMQVYKKMDMGKNFFIPYMDRLAGNNILKEQIMSGSSEQEIRKSWQPGLDAFRGKAAKVFDLPGFYRKMRVENHFIKNGRAILSVKLYPNPGRETVMLLHGGPGVPDEMTEARESLASIMQVITFDQRGTGLSPVCSGLTYNLEDYTADINRIADAFNLDSFHLFGHSWGGLYAQLYVQDFSPKIKSLFLCSPASGTGEIWKLTEKEVLDYNRKRSTNPEWVMMGLNSLLGMLGSSKACHRLFRQVIINYNKGFNVPPPDDEKLANIKAASFNRTRRAIARHAGLKNMGNTPFPVIITYGNEDAYGNSKEFVYGRFPGARREIIPACGHNPWKHNLPAFEKVLKSFYHDIFKSDRFSKPVRFLI